MAYEIFDGKYTMTELYNMPYRQLLYYIELEQEFQSKLNKDVENSRNKAFRRIK